jgi:polyhydroxyalkanoate synthase
MKERPSNGASLVEAWTQLVDTTMAGYCIAGQMQATTLSYLAAKGDKTVNAATFVVTLADFQAEINDLISLFDETALRVAERQMEERGVLGSREMSTMFRMLRANDLIWSSVINNYFLGKESPAFDVLFWNNDGTRMTEKAQRHEGGWWADWLEWLKARSGELVAPPPMGSATYPPIIPAPGTYVLEK